MIKLIKTPLLFTILALSPFVFSQENFQYTYFLKSGIMLKGYIFEHDTAFIRLINESNKVIVINKKEIIKFEKQPTGRIILNTNRRFKSNGFQSKFEYVNGSSSYSRASNGIQIITGHKFNNRFFGGIGIGAKLYHNQLAFNSDMSCGYPFFFRFSSDLWVNKSTPYIFSDVGFLFEKPKSTHRFKPPLFRLGLGNKFILKRTTMYSGLNYAYTKSRYRNDIGDTNFSKWFNGHSAEVSLGFQIN